MHCPSHRPRCSIANDGLIIVRARSIVRERSAGDAHRPSHRPPLWHRGRCDTFFIFNLILFNFQNLYIFSLFSLIFHFFHSQIHTTYSTLQTKCIPKITQVRIVQYSVVHDGRVQNPTTISH